MGRNPAVEGPEVYSIAECFPKIVQPGQPGKRSVRDPVGQEIEDAPGTAGPLVGQPKLISGPRTFHL